MSSIRQSFSYPGITDSRLITFFEREDRESLMRIIGELAAEMAQQGKSAMVHVEGTRSLSCRQQVVKMSSAFIDMALAVGAPIVPVRFVSGLPAEELSQRIEFPVGYGRQDFWIGRPVLPEQLRSLPLKERKQVVIDAINGLGPGPEREEPSAPDPAFADRVETWRARTGTSRAGGAARDAGGAALVSLRGDAPAPRVDAGRTADVRRGSRGALARGLRALAPRAGGRREHEIKATTRDQPSGEGRRQIERFSHSGAPLRATHCSEADERSEGAIRREGGK